MAILYELIVIYYLLPFSFQLHVWYLCIHEHQPNRSCVENNCNLATILDIVNDFQSVYKKKIILVPFIRRIKNYIYYSILIRIIGKWKTSDCYSKCLFFLYNSYRTEVTNLLTSYYQSMCSRKRLWLRIKSRRLSSQIFLTGVLWHSYKFPLLDGWCQSQSGQLVKYFQKSWRLQLFTKSCWIRFWISGFWETWGELVHMFTCCKLLQISGLIHICT